MSDEPARVTRQDFDIVIEPLYRQFGFRMTPEAQRKHVGDRYGVLRTFDGNTLSNAVRALLTSESKMPPIAAIRQSCLDDLRKRNTKSIYTVAPESEEKFPPLTAAERAHWRQTLRDAGIPEPKGKRGESASSTAALLTPNAAPTAASRHAYANLGPSVACKTCGSVGRWAIHRRPDGTEYERMTAPCDPAKHDFGDKIVPYPENFVRWAAAEQAHPQDTAR